MQPASSKGHKASRLVRNDLGNGQCYQLYCGFIGPCRRDLAEFTYWFSRIFKALGFSIGFQGQGQGSAMRFRVSFRRRDVQTRVTEQQSLRFARTFLPMPSNNLGTIMNSMISYTLQQSHKRTMAYTLIMMEIEDHQDSYVGT